ncbi:arginase family protein [Candidatus Lokiarchaeum ossiferum]|uniref:arginase family protein n=1 Tax=Candidatus Lokiarchaeum ossiferum TaxID=2951803 RepID=UPI00352EF6B8
MQFEKDLYGTFGGLVDPSYKGDEDIIYDAVIQGIPYEAATSGKKGTSYAMKALRAISQDMQIISRTGRDFSSIKIFDAGDVPIFPLDSEETRKAIENAFMYLRKTYHCPIISIGGDHSVTYPLIKGLQNEGKVGVVWFDAHRDLLDDFLRSKYSHGTSLRRAIDLPNVEPSNVLLVGTRYFTPEEEKVVQDLGIHELRKVDLENSSNWISDFQSILKEIESRVDYLYISLDIDGLDPACAPGTGTPVCGGVFTHELMQMLSSIQVPIAAYDIVEVSPPLDSSGITVKTMMGILTELLAKIFSLKF